MLPLLKRLLVEHDVEQSAISNRQSAIDYRQSAPMRFHYQYPPSFRVQPGPSEHYGRLHRDAEVSCCPLSAARACRHAAKRHEIAKDAIASA